MRLFYNRSLGQLVSFAGGNASLTEGPAFKWRDPARIELAVYPDAGLLEPVQLTNPDTLQVGLKSTAANTGPIIVGSTSWAWDSDELVYYTTLNFNTFQLARLFVGASALNNQTGTSYTPVLADANKLITLTNGSDISVTVPTNASVAYAVGAVIYLLRGSAGVPTIAPDTGVTLAYVTDVASGAMDANTIYALTKTATNAWTLSLATEAASVALSFEITGIDGDSTQTLTSTVYSDVIRGHEGNPANSEEPNNYYTKAQSDARYLQSVPSEFLTQTEGDARYLQSIPGEYLTQTEGDARYLQSIADGSISTAKLANLAVTGEKLENISGLSASVGRVLIKSLAYDAKGRITGVKLKYAASITANATKSASTTDLDVLTLTIPAGTLEVGDMIEFELFGTTNNSTTASNFLTWIKINGTKTTAITHAMGTVAASNVGWHMRGLIRADNLLGSPANNLTCSFTTQWKLTQAFSNANTASLNLNTTALTITPGLNFSVATGAAATVYNASAAMQ